MAADNKPKVRFEGFEDEFKYVKLGMHSNIITGGTPNSNETLYWQDGTIPWMSSGEINKKHIFSTDKLISQAGFDNSSAKWVKEKSVLIALAGQGKTRGTVAVNEIALTTNQSIAAIEPDDNMHYEFVYQNLENRYDELRLISSGDGSRGGLNKKIIGDISLAIPSFKEQEQIGTLFELIDERIRLHKERKASMEEAKKSYMQKMFPKGAAKEPEMRFGGFEGEWEVSELGQLTNIKTGGKDVQDAVEDGKYPFFIRSDEVKQINSYSFDGEAILIPGEGRLGEIFHYINGKFDYHQRVYKISDFIGVNGLYVLNFMKFRFKQHALKFTVKATVDSLRLPMITEFKISYPSLPEQQLIGAFFQALDEKIQLEDAAIEQAERMKKASLQMLFV